MTDSSHGSLYLISCSTPAVRRITSEEPATGWFNMCFASKTQVSRTIRTSISLRASAKISSDFALLSLFHNLSVPNTYALTETTHSEGHGRLKVNIPEHSLFMAFTE